MIGIPRQAASAKKPDNPVSLAEATRVWAKIGWLGFGGPAGQIALMHRELVEQRRWISDARFLHALRKARVHIVALHSHMIGEHPSFYFTHFWSTGKAEDLAHAFRAALDAQAAVRKP